MSACPRFFVLPFGSPRQIRRDGAIPFGIFHCLVWNLSSKSGQTIARTALASRSSGLKRRIWQHCLEVRLISGRKKRAACFWTAPRQQTKCILGNRRASLSRVSAPPFLLNVINKCPQFRPHRLDVLLPHAYIQHSQHRRPPKGRLIFLLSCSRMLMILYPIFDT